MNLKSVLKNLTVAGIAFSLSLAYLQSLHMGFKKENIILTVKGEGLKGLKASFSNRYVRNFAFDTCTIEKNSDNSVSFSIPVYAFVHNLHLELESTVRFRLTGVEFYSNNQKISIKKGDFPNFLRYPYNNPFPEVSLKQESNGSTSTLYILKTRSTDLSKLIKDLYIKKIPITISILISILFSVIVTTVFHRLSAANKKITPGRSLGFLIPILLIMFLTQKFFFSSKVDKTLMEDFNIFDYFGRSSDNNLVYNGDFRNGLLFWTSFADSTMLQIIDTPFGRGVKVTRGDGDGGYWSLRYVGRSIIYYKNHTYQIRFKYKIIRGNGIPFSIGWWVKQGGKNVGYRLKVSSILLKDEWFQAEASYTFQEKQSDLACFLNSLKDYSEVDITDVEIIDLSREKDQINFTDQLDNIKLNLPH